tara:strand:- start:1178 stop:1468 length:291 start_codon:yes stop_codon:yes gene_type:complete
MRDMNYIVNPKTIVEIAETVNGYDKIKPFLDKVDVLLTAKRVAEEWTLNQNPDEGFGSSDTTFVVKDYIDCLIDEVILWGQLKTAFPNGFLGIVER